MRRVIILLFVLGIASSASAQPSIVAPRAIVMDPSANDSIVFSQAPTNRALQGSIGKLMTAYVTVWAVNKGLASWGDTVSLSQRDSAQQCSCMKFTNTFNTVPNPNGPGTVCRGSTVSATQPGEAFRLDDLLQVTLNQSTGESTDAVAEWIARKVYNKGAPASVQDSEKLLNLFVGLMNQRAKDLGLNDSRWVTVHGGDNCDFKIGCDPDCTPNSCNLTKCKQGEQCGGGTTVKDLARLWHALTRDSSKFLPLIGVRAFNLQQAKPGQPFYNSYVHGFNYFPGLDGDKNGGSGACPNTSGSAPCFMAQATRAGHPLIAVALQSFKPIPATANGILGSGAADLQALFRYGYSVVLAPNRRLDAAPGFAEVVKDHAFACREGMCATGVRAADDSLKLIVWNAAVPDANLGRIATFAAASGAGHYAPISALDVAFNDLWLVAGVVMNGKVTLAVWQLESGGGLAKVKISFKGDAAAGSGTLVKLSWLADDLLLAAARDAGGNVLLSTWRLASGGTVFTPLGQLTVPSLNIGATGELAIAANASPPSNAIVGPIGGGLFSKASYQAIAATSTGAGDAALQKFRIDGSGAITAVGTTPLGTARHVAIATQGRGKFGVSFTNGASAAGNTRFEAWDIADGGTSERTIAFTESSATTETAIAPLGPAASKTGIVPSKTLTPPTNILVSGSCPAPAPAGGPSTQKSQGSAVAFLVASTGMSGATLAAWDSPRFYKEPGVLVDYRLADSSNLWGVASSIRLGRASSDPLQNTFVTEQLAADGTLKVIGWTIGKNSP